MPGKKLSITGEEPMRGNLGMGGHALTEVSGVTNEAGTTIIDTLTGAGKLDTLTELTLNAGVTVETVLIKDGLVDGIDLSAWLDQSVKQAATPAFGGLTITPFITAGILHNATTGLISSSLIVNADIDAGAAIALTKMATQANNTILGNISGGVAVPSALAGSNVRTICGLATTDQPYFTGLNITNTIYCDAYAPSGTASLDFYSSRMVLDGTNLTLQAPINFVLKGQFKILEGGATPIKYSIFQGGDQVADLTYTLPPALGAGVRCALTDVAGNGILSWGQPWTSEGYLTTVQYSNMPDIAQYEILGRIAAGSDSCTALAVPNLIGANGLNGLTYASASFVKMTGANTFTLDTNTYLTAVTAHNLLSATHGDALADSVLAGDILIGNATPKWARLAAGTDGYILNIDSTTHLPKWIAPSGVGTFLPLAGGTMAGNIVMANGGTIGCAGEPVLTFDDTLNRLYCGSFITVADGKGIGANGQYLQYNAGDILVAGLLTCVNTSLRFKSADGASKYVSLIAGTMAADYNLTLPTTLATAGVIKNAAGGALSSATIINADVASNAAIATTKLGAGAVVQVVNYERGDYVSGVTPTPMDDTIPAITEGNLFLTRTITPKSVTNNLFIQIVLFIGCTVTADCVTVALHNGGNAIAVTRCYIPSVLNCVTIPLNYFMAAGSTSELTFTVRAGITNATPQTCFINGNTAGGRLYGGAACSSITITEIVG